MAEQKISQRRFIKGLVASAQQFAEPQGIVKRISNLVMTVRGSLKACDGSFNFAQGRPQTLWGPAPGVMPYPPITEVFLYEPLGANNQYFVIWKDSFRLISAPSAPTAVDGGAGGLLGAGNYQWKITVVDQLGGETIASGASGVLGLAANHKANLSWTAYPGAAGYNVYRTTAGPGPTFLLVNGATPITTNSYVDNVPDGSLGTQQPPVSSTALATNFMAVEANGTFTYNVDSIKLFPADFIAAQDGTLGGGGGAGGGGGGGGGGTPTSGAPPTPAGGVIGNISAIPQIVQFSNKMILALGNGYPPYSSDGTTPNTVALTNTFNPTYPAWIATTAFVAGDLINAVSGPTTYIFKCIQSGVSAAAPPAWPATLNATVADAKIIWQNIGPLPASVAPRGAAHAIVYAGSLWLYNTSPTNTSDGLDGPSCLKMSDLNNPSSWNPLNVAFLDKDDGSQGMGLATFTIAEAGIIPTGSLVCFKEFSTFQINGVFGASNFSIQRAQTDLGCVAPRSIQFVPGFGIIRFTHLGFAVFDGVRDRVLSEEIRPYIFGGLSDVQAVDWNYVYFAKGAQTARPPMYMAAMPILSQSTNTLTGVSAAAQAAGASIPLTPGNYYVKPAVVDQFGNTNFAPEIGPVTVGANQVINVSYGNTPTGSVIYRAWFGTSPGGESLFSDNTAVTLLASVVLNGNVFLGQPASSKPGTPSAAGAGALSRLFCYDLVLKGWTVIDVPWPISVLKQVRSPGSIPLTIAAGFMDGILRRLQATDTTWDPGLLSSNPTINWNLTSASVFGKASSDRVYFRRLVVRGSGSPTGMVATFTTDGATGQSVQTQNFTVNPMGGGQFYAYVDIASTAIDAYVKIAGSGIVEIDSIDWMVAPKPSRALVVAG